MPYLAHGTLQNVLRQHRRLSLQHAIAYVKQAAEALDYAHSRGIVHRDLKPSNFLLNERGDLILADFGIARLMQQQHYMQQVALKTRTDMFIGTPLYAAPEMIQAGEIDHRVDIYELGIVFFQMLYGDVPFKGENDYAILHQHVTSSLPQLSQQVPGIPDEIDIVLQKATAKRREDRYSSAGEFARALHHIIHRPQQPAHPPPHEQHHVAPIPELPPTILPTPHQGGPLHLQKNHLQAADIVGPTTPALPIAPPNKSRPIRTMIILVACLLLISSMFLANRILRPPGPSSNNSTQTAAASARGANVSPTPTLTPDQLQAEGVIGQFYADINNRDYEHAYMLLYPSSKPTDMVSQSGNCSTYYSAFLKGYAPTEHTAVQFVSISSSDNQQQFKAQFIIQATEYLPTGIRKSTYHFYDFVKQEGSGWQIIPGGNYLPPVSGTVTPSTTTGTTPADQPQTIVQRYFDALKVGNYPLAYSFFSQSYSTSYCDFVLAHTNRLYDNPAISQVTQQADNTVLVAVNVYVTQPPGAGGVTTMEQDNFTFAQEQGVWKIVSIATPTKNAS